MFSLLRSGMRDDGELRGVGDSRMKDEGCNLFVA